jgi:lysophospholipase L1-like esterase
VRRVWKVLLTAVVAVGAVGVPSAQVIADDDNATRYYLALGDSLAQGFQFPMPGQPYYSPDGYVPLVHTALSADDRKLDLNNISCGGESTVSMLSGSQPPSVASSCGSPDFYLDLYPHEVQLDEAVNFLHAHKGKVAVVTIDIGSNDVLPCLSTLDPACIQLGLGRIATNLDRILDELQATAPGVRIVGMTYYNPIACVLPVNPGLAAASQQIVLNLNGVLLSVYAAHGVEVADVAGAFDVADLPASAQAAAAFTWFCDKQHSGNVHPNSDGYRVIADAFLDVLAP